MVREANMDTHIGACEGAVERIAHVRRMAEVSGADMEEFDERLNKLCSEKHEKYANMSDVELAIYGLKMIIEAGNFEDFADFIAKEAEEEEE